MLDQFYVSLETPTSTIIFILWLSFTLIGADTVSARITSTSKKSSVVTGTQQQRINLLYTILNQYCNMRGRKAYQTLASLSDMSVRR